MKTPLVSICCLTYNHENYIAECLDGFIMQKTDFDYEILIHDDASTDGTAGIIREYELRYPEIVKPIYQIENQYSKGIKPTFKYNFPRAHGKYIALCEGDDYWTDPLKLQKQVDFLEGNNDYSACFHQVNVIKGDKKIIIGVYTNLNKDIFCTEDLFGAHFIATCSLIFRKSFLPSKIPNVASGDKWLLLNLSVKGNIKFLSDNMGVYRLHANGISNTHFGIKKVYDMAYLLNLFNEHNNYQYTNNCYQSLEYEINVNLVRMQTPKYVIESTKTLILIKTIIKRILSKFHNDNL